MQIELCLENPTPQSLPASVEEPSPPPNPLPPEQMASLEEGRKKKLEYYREWRRKKYPNPRPKRPSLTPITKEFILQNITIDPVTKCWIWKRSKSKGYGTVWDGITKKRLQVHRKIYELWVGPIPDGLWVLHDCPNGDNKSCCNWEHMFLGTNSDNIIDAYDKGIMKYPSPKLSEDQVRMIRCSPKRGCDLAKELNVRPQDICNVRKGKTYKRVK